MGVQTSPLNPLRLLCKRRDPTPGLSPCLFCFLGCVRLTAQHSFTLSLPQLAMQLLVLCQDQQPFSFRLHQQLQSQTVVGGKLNSICISNCPPLYLMQQLQDKSVLADQLNFMRISNCRVEACWKDYFSCESRLAA